jgi:superfamily I DNA/RNA helicase
MSSKLQSKFNPTQEQLCIVETFKSTQVLKVNAVAGSGKTSTLLLLADEFKQPSLLLAFNKAIADEASKRFPAHVQCRTMNSVAYAEFGRALQHKLNLNKNPKLNTMRSIKNTIDWFKLQDYDMATPAISARVIANLSREAVERFCHSSRLSISESDLYKKDFTELQKNHEFSSEHLKRAVVNLAKLIWRERINPISCSFCTHDTYVKLWSLSNPELNYDILYIDESQDINPCVLSVLEKQTCKVVYVGDQYQSIYGFRGAINAMKNIQAPTLSLSQSWRYGEAIAGVAECILSKDSVTVKGNPCIKSILCDVPQEEHYTMIFRTNAELLNQAEQLIDSGVSVQIEINVKDFIRQVNSVIELKKGSKPFHDNIARFGSFPELLEYAKESVEIQRLLNTAMRADVQEFLSKLESNNLCSNPSVILTTAHKSKGLEFDNVVVANDFKFGENDLLSMPEQELNLLYVACTRAKKKLQLPCVLKMYYDRNKGV